MGNIKVTRRKTSSVFIPIRRHSSPEFKLKQAQSQHSGTIRHLWAEYRRSRLALKKAKLEFKISTIK